MTVQERTKKIWSATIILVKKHILIELREIKKWLSRPKSQRQLGAVLLVVVILAVGYQISSSTADPLPSRIESKLTFSPFVLPKGTKNYTATNYSIISPEGTVQELKYLIQTKDGSTIWLSEYQQPPQFSEIPDYKDRFLTNINQQESVQTSNGIIYLGRLSHQSNKQVGIMIEKGLLVFMSPDQDMKQSQWRNLGDQLVIQKINKNY
jgi:hypothetical protein